MMLGLDNSTAEGSPLEHTMCKLTLFAPYWLDNRTGTDLIFHDKLSAPGRAMLLGGHFPWDHGVVRAPGERPGMCDCHAAWQAQRKQRCLEGQLLLPEPDCGAILPGSSF